MANQNLGITVPKDIPSNSMPTGKSLGSGQNISKRHGMSPAIPSGIGASEKVPVYQGDLKNPTE